MATRKKLAPSWKIMERALTQSNMKVIDHLAKPIEDYGYNIDFTILGNTGNIYNVVFNLDTTIEESTKRNVTCSCPYYVQNYRVCKHIYLVYIKIFRLLPTIISEDTHITQDQSKMLFNLYKTYVRNNIEPPELKIESRNSLDDECPVCFEKLHPKNFVCHQCRNSIHNDCIKEVIKYNKHCPLCRAEIIDTLMIEKIKL